MGTRIRKSIVAVLLLASFALIPSLSVAGTTVSTEKGRVVKVVDGDTLNIQIGTTPTKVRIIGIDTPETVDPRKTVQCFGIEASKQMTRLVNAKTVTLEKNPAEDKDKYGRLLRYVSLNGNDIGAQMIRDGYAFSYKVFPHTRLDAYNQLEKKAREGGKGLWSSCDSKDMSKPAKAVSTTRTSSSSSVASKAGCTIKGNISATGEKIYHLPSCGNYKQTVITSTTGERWFCTETEAKAAGWRKASNCR